MINIQQQVWGRGAVGLACRTVTPVAASSSLVVPAIDRASNVLFMSGDVVQLV